MTLGLDFNGVLTSGHPKLRQLAKQFDRVIIISSTNSPKEVTMAVRRSMFPHDKLILLPFTHYRNIPREKLQACRSEHVDVYIDDQQPVCDLLNKSGILGLKYQHPV